MYVARILPWESCKFGEKIYYSNWDNEFFLRGRFYWRTCSHVSVRPLQKKMSGRTEKVTLFNAFLQIGLTDLDEIWHDGRS